MQTIKKLLLVLPLALALTACGGGGDSEGGSTDSAGGSSDGLTQAQVESAVLLDVAGYERVFELTTALPLNATATYEADDSTRVSVDAVQGLVGPVENTEENARLQFLDQSAELNTDSVNGVTVYSGEDEGSYKALTAAGDYQFKVQVDLDGDAAAAMGHVEAVVEALTAALADL